MSRNVVVTGAAGRVGRRLMVELDAAGHSVRGLDRAPGANTERVETVELTDPKSVEAALRGADIVVHLAAFMSWREADAAEVFRASVDASFVLLEVLRSMPGTELVLASTGDVYPESRPQYLPIDEAHPRRPMSHYGMSKLLVEEMVAFYERRYNLAATILRLPHTQDAAELLDPDSPMSGPRFFLRSKLAQQRSFHNASAMKILAAHDDGTEKLLLSLGQDGTPYTMPICDTRDTVAGILAAIDSPSARGQTIALGPPRATCFADAVPRMSELTGLPYVEVRLPGPAINYAVDLTKAERLLGFVPHYSFHQMLDDAAAAFHARRQS